MILPDHLCAGLDVVFCGTAAGDRSAARGRYYAGPGNKFWRTLHITGLTPALLTPDHDGRLGDYGIGLTDLVKHHSGSDNSLRRDMYDIAGLERKIVEHAPRFVAFNGKKGAAAYLGHKKTTNLNPGLQDWLIGEARVYVLPSTSGNASGYWDVEPWHELARSMAGQRNRRVHP
jgi:double-stranded uracil-DNA glycosylase